MTLPPALLTLSWNPPDGKRWTDRDAHALEGHVVRVLAAGSTYSGKIGVAWVDDFGGLNVEADLQPHVDTRRGPE